MPLVSKQNADANPHRPAPGIAPLDAAVSLLAAGDPVARRTAAQALAAQPQGAHDEAALETALDAEPEPAVRSAILDALFAWAERGSEDAVATLAGCLRGEDVALRNAAIVVLRGLPDQVAPVMAHLLVDGDRDVRILAVGILESLRHERVEEWLLQLIDADADVNVCGVALDVLAEVATPGARTAVESVLARFPDEPYIDFAGRLVLARLGEGAA
jgi:HEAT repeat protein